MKRPFSLTALPQEVPGILELRLVFRDPLSVQEKQGWQDVVKTFVDLANCGALSGSAILPAESGCVLERECLSDRNGHWWLGQTAVDASAFNVLLNLCHWGHINVSELDGFVLAWERCQPAKQAIQILFPGAWPRLSYELTGYELVGQTIAIDIDFQSSQSTEKREEINDSLGYWFKAANWGGYADDQFPLPGSTVLIAPEIMTSDPARITWYIEAFLCSDYVLDGLINCLERICVTQAPIRKVTIGE